MSTFSGLNTATTALWANQRGMDITGQNVANVNTDGYSRQRAELQSIGGSTVPAIYSVGNGIGQGVSADQISRMRDAFLEGRAQVEHATTARLTVQSEALGQIEQAFREPGETGIQSMLSDVWAGWGDVANNPQDIAGRSQLLQRTQTLVDGIKSTAATLGQQWSQTRENLGALVADVNAAATSIAGYNEAIRRAVQTNTPANELVDKRDALILGLADKIGATSSAGADGMVNVLVGGSALVAGTTTLTLQLAGRTSVDGTTPPGEPRIQTSPGGATVAVGGTAQGQLEVLTDDVAGIPAYRKKLDAFAQQLADTLNAQQRKGVDADGDGVGLGDGGSDLLGPASGTGPVTAANIRLLITRPEDFAAASLADGVGGASLGNGNADAMARLGDSSGLDASYRDLITGLGVQSAVSSRNTSIQTVISAQVDTSRESVSGVNLDEEMTNMLAYQHGYQAAGRLVTAIDEMLDQLINRTGRVGL